MYDFAVVGAGPAGSRFARRAAEAGHDVAVFEGGEIGRPLACSGHVSTDVLSYVPESERAALHQNDVYGARFHLGGADSRAYPFYKASVVSNVIDRVGLDRALARAARDAGASVRENHTVTGVAEFDDRVELAVKADGGTHTVEARMVAGCDGPRSRVRRALDLPEPDELLHGVLGFDERPDHDDFVDVHLTVPGFFAWRIPRGEAGVEYGLAAAPDDDVSERFDALVAEYGADVTRTCSGAIPVGPPARIRGHRGFLAGDAAGQTKPFTGGGIRYGMTAADCAARTVDPDDPGTLADYERAVDDELRREIRLGALVRRAYGLPRPVQRLGLWALSGEIGVHMDRPSSLFSRDQLRALFR